MPQGALRIMMAKLRKNLAQPGEEHTADPQTGSHCPGRPIYGGQQRAFECLRLASDQ